MWWFGKKTTRRKEIRRSKAERTQPVLQRLAQRLPIPTLALGLVGAIAAALVVNLGGDAFGLRVGQTLPRALTARIEFERFNHDGTHAARLSARNTSPNYYRLDAAILEDIRGALANALTIAQTYRDAPQKIRDEAAKNQVNLDDDGLAELVRVAGLEDPSVYSRAVDGLIDKLRGQALVEASDLARRRTPLVAILLDPERQQAPAPTVAVGNLLVSDADAVRKVAETVSAAFVPALRPLRASVEQSLISLLNDDDHTKAPYRFDGGLTAQRAQAAWDAVEDQYDTFPRGSVIADAGRISAAEVDLLRTEHAAYRSQLEAGGFAGLAQGANLGRALLAFLATIAVFAHYGLFVPGFSPRLLRQLSTAAILVGLLVLMRLVYVHASMLPAHIALAGQAGAVAILSIAYHNRASVYPLAMTLAFLMTLATQQGLEFFFVLFTVSVVLAVLLSNVRYRAQIVGAGALAALAGAAATLVANLLDEQALAFAFWQAAWAAGTTLAAGFVVEGLLPGVERLFKTSTSMTLLEWCDSSKPLMRSMAAEAPGTYNHSLLVGTLAEAAADGIGANGLLCRAGAYYHDIGKINKPEYFVENQAMRPNRHERLSPAMSLLIIIGHVKDGIEMAKEYRVPASLRPFIAEHHGTTLVEYFYHAASKSRKPNDPAVSDTEFRYPGPRPQSRESAVLMLCDGIEGAVRAMSEPTPGRIEDVVNRITEKRLMDGQFDECDLTFREIAIIKSSLVKSLCAIYHSRIKYPSQDEDDSKDQQSVGA